MNILQSVKKLLARRASLQKEIRKIDKIIAPFGAVEAKASVSVGRKRQRRKMSKAARERIAAAQRERWAKWKAAKKGSR